MSVVRLILVANIVFVILVPVWLAAASVWPFITASLR